MSDLTHLNEYGATLITNELMKKININKGETTMYIINSGSCE